LFLPEGASYKGMLILQTFFGLYIMKCALFYVHVLVQFKKLKAEKV
jgi:hypothetical protein